MEIVWFDELPSTQNFLIEHIRSGGIKAPVCIAAHSQSSGIGSRSNSWEQIGDALLFSFAMPVENMPEDLKIESASIYFMYIFKQILEKHGCECWFKWPNDIYTEDKKIAGAITSFISAKQSLICGIGLNLAPNEKFGFCKLKTDKKNLLSSYLAVFTTPPSWKQIFSNFEVEFSKTRDKFINHGSIQCHENVTLNSDGSLNVGNEKVFSLR